MFDIKVHCRGSCNLVIIEEIVNHIHYHIGVVEYFIGFCIGTIYSLCVIETMDWNVHDLSLSSLLDIYSRRWPTRIQEVTHGRYGELWEES